MNNISKEVLGVLIENILSKYPKTLFDKAYKLAGYKGKSRHMVYTCRKRGKISLEMLRAILTVYNIPKEALKSLEDLNRFFGGLSEFGDKSRFLDGIFVELEKSVLYYDDLDVVLGKITYIKKLVESEQLRRKYMR